MATFIFPAQSVSISGGATEAKQDTMILELQDVNTELDSQTTILTSLDSKDFATETSLAALNAKVTAVDTTGKSTEAKQDDIITLLTSLDGKDYATQTTLAALLATDFATETSLSSLNSKVTAVDTTGKSTEAKQDTMITSLSNLETDIGALEDRLAGSLVPETYDEVEVTYVGSTEDVNTVVYKLATATVATLTLSYDGNGRLSGVVKS